MGLRQADDCGDQVQSSWQERLMVDDVGVRRVADEGASVVVVVVVVADECEVESADASSSSNWMMEGADVPCFNPPSKDRPQGSD